MRVPGLSGAIPAPMEKARWLGLPTDINEDATPNVQEFYASHPVIATYLEHHLNTKGKSMTLHDRPYLLEILMDQSKEIVVQKCVQCGLTEIALTRAFTSACMGRAVLYTLPSHPVRNRFVANRVDRVLKTAPYYRAQLSAAMETFGNKTADARALKHLGLGVLHFVGSNTAGEFSEFPADELIVDEQDLCDPENLGLAKDRLSESDYKRILRISNPRKPGAPHSIGRLYEFSDQKVWEVQCSHCKHYQELKWEKHFVQKVARKVVGRKPPTGEHPATKGWKLRDPNKKARPVCEKCHKPFDRLGPGRWQAQHPKRKLSGYKLSKLFLPSADIEDLFQTFIEAAYNDSLLAIFYGSDLGEYYVPETARITLADLKACIDTRLEDWPELPGGGNLFPVVMGVDVGSVLHYKASYITQTGKRVALAIGTVSTFGELEEVADNFHPDLILIDAHPEVHKVNEFAEESKHEVWVCNFGSPEQIQPIKIKYDVRPVCVVANRTAVMDGSFASMRKKELVLPMPAEGVQHFFHQMQVPSRQLDPNAGGGKGRYIWTKGEDHYRLADTYEWIAAQCLAETETWGEVLS